MFIDIDTSSKYEMTSCDTVKKFAGYYVPCTECPFKDCVYKCKPEKLRLLFSVKKIKQAWNEIDTGITPSNTIKNLKITKNQYYYWKNNRITIKNRLCEIIEI